MRVQIRSIPVRLVLKRDELKDGIWGSHLKNKFEKLLGQFLWMLGAEKRSGDQLLDGADELELRGRVYA